MENKSVISDETQTYARETIFMSVKTINGKSSTANTNQKLIITAKPQRKPVIGAPEQLDMDKNKG